MATYSQLKTALIQYLATHFASLGITSSLVSFADLDGLIKTMKSTNATYGVYLEFSSAGRQKREVFASREWQWGVVGVFVIAYRGNLSDIETQLSLVMDSLRTLFKGNETLSGVTSFASIDTIESADPVTFADMPFYWVPFSMSFVDKL